ncbi:hypothetical protein BofuT4_uP097380.1 [Botrytis cinerea T4]|uniref:Uncharacterized protein n=1 Tax=Botryotinia fuckeliana (strain T4) TaxID=999810 RepID=G2YCY2_BOTF4|nr:hypothetical protein BofuT4_uP097380.1 [Botrytis cinerea T4]
MQSALRKKNASTLNMTCIYSLLLTLPTQFSSHLAPHRGQHGVITCVGA